MTTEKLVSDAQIRETIYRNREILAAIEDNVDAEYEEFLASSHCFNSTEGYVYEQQIIDEIMLANQENGQSPQGDPLLVPKTINKFTYLQKAEQNYSKEGLLLKQELKEIRSKAMNTKK